MLSQFRARLTYGNVVASLALFLALGGTSYAVATGSIDSREIKNNSIRSADVKDGGLLAKDFKSGQLPAGQRGPQGARGAAGQDATKLFAYIRDAGNSDVANVEYGKGVTAVDDDVLPSAGHYTVTFNRSLVNCVVVANQGIGNPNKSTAATIGPAHPDVGVGLVEPNKAMVTFYNGSNVTADTAFMITALC